MCTPLFDLAGTNLIKRVEQYLFVHGCSRKELAYEIGIDPASLSRLIDEKKVSNRTRKSVEKFFQL